LKQLNSEILFGIHPITEALNSGRRKFKEIYFSSGKQSQRLDKLIEFANSRSIPIQHVSHQQLNTITSVDGHQGIAAKVSQYSLLPLHEIIKSVQLEKKFGFYLLADSIVDPHNLGALIRTALCVGVTGVIIPKDRSAGPSPFVSKTSAGALEHIKVAKVINLVNAIKDLKKKNVWIIGLDKTGDQSIYDTDFTRDVAIVIGGEEKGIRPLIKHHCDFLSFIPQTGPVNSLNASVAGGVAMREAFRQRG